MKLQFDFQNQTSREDQVSADISTLNLPEKK